MNRHGHRFASNKLASALLCLALGATAPVLASHPGDSGPIDQQVVSATNQLLAALASWEQSAGPQRAAGVAQLVQLAQQRQLQLIALVKADPVLAAARLLPKSLRMKMPAAAAAHVEREVTVNGNALAHVSDDFASGHSNSVHKLAGADAVDLDLHFADPRAGQRALNRMSGKKVRLDAMRIGNQLLILEHKHVQVQAFGAEGGGSSAPTAASVVQGNQKTLSILVNFSDKAHTCTAAQLSDRLFGTTGPTVNNHFAESSRGLVSFSGAAVGPFPINYTSTGTCNYTGWASAADAAARAAGFDPAQYQRVNYVTPGNTTCGWSGLANMPGKQSWVQSCTATGTFSHEFGHNLALHHASTPTSEYGDGSDPMGGARVVGHNSANRTMAGWMPAGSVQDVGVGGSYALSSLSVNEAATSPQVLRLPKPDTGEVYYVSLRTATNVDTTLGAAYLNNLSVHRATGTLPTRTYLLQNVAVGQSFVDTTNGLTITNQGQSGAVATVGVSFGNGACVRSAPIVSTSPASQTTAPGGSAGYTVSVTNANTAACGSTSFALGQVMPSGFTGGFAAASLAVAPGATATTTWTVGSGTGTASGTYTLTASAAESSGGSGTSLASQIVYADTLAPTLSISSPTAGAVLPSTKAVTITAQASDDGGMQAVEFYVDGKLLARDTGAPYSASWNPRKVSKGLHTIRVRALDNAGNATEQSITVTVN